MLKNTQILKSLFIIALIAVVGFMTTQALFIDREQSKENTFVVGTLEMNVTGPGSTKAESINVTGVGAQNVVAGGKSWIIKNTGSLPGDFSFDLANIHNFENGCNDPETAEDTTCDNPGDGQGELGQAIRTTILLEENGQAERTIFTSELSNQAATQYGVLWKNNAGTIRIPAGKSITITMRWATDEDKFKNNVQSDSVGFDILFNLKQVGQAVTEP